MIRLRSPRWRWNTIATLCGGAPFRDGLTIPARPDKLAEDLKSQILGRGRPDRGMSRAYQIYRSDSARTIWDSMLFALCKAGQEPDWATCGQVLHESQDLVRLYSQLFFDVTVFAAETDKLVFLDQYVRLDHRAALIMRNTMGLDRDGLMHAADMSRAERIDPKTALEEGLTTYYKLARIFGPLAIAFEARIAEDPASRERFEWIFKQYNMSTSRMKEFAHELLAFELDKSAENFLEEFVMRLEKVDNDQLIVDKNADGQELV